MHLKCKHVIYKRCLQSVFQLTSENMKLREDLQEEKGTFQRQQLTTEHVNNMSVLLQTELNEVSGMHKGGWINVISAFSRIFLFLLLSICWSKCIKYTSESHVFRYLFFNMYFVTNVLNLLEIKVQKLSLCNRYHITVTQTFIRWSRMSFINTLFCL